MNREYLVDTCPQCGAVVKYYPNPYYLYTHPREEGGCGFEGTKKDVVQKIDMAKLDEEINEHLQSVHTLRELCEKYDALPSMNN